MEIRVTISSKFSLCRIFWYIYFSFFSPFRVETSDGSKHEETGTFRYVGGLAVRGSYEFVDDDGKVHKVNYVADEKGFRPEIVDWGKIKKHKLKPDSVWFRLPRVQ